MKWNKFYLFPILHVVLVYAMSFWVSFLVDYIPENMTKLFLFAYIAGVVIMNIVACKKYCKAENERILLVSALIVKYGLIPFFAILACVAIVLLMFTFIPVPIMIFLGPGGAIIISILCWIVVAISTPYTIAYLHSSRKAGNRHIIFVWLHTICQFILWIDVFDIMFLSIKEKVWRKFTVVLLIGFVLAVVVGIVALALGIANFFVK